MGRRPRAGSRPRAVRWAGSRCVMAVQSYTLLKGALSCGDGRHLGSNPVRDLYRSVEPQPRVRGLTTDELREMLSKLRASEYCQKHDLVDPITLFVATGLRRSELLGLRWVDYDEKTGTLSVTGKVIRAAGKGLHRIDGAKTAAGRRTVPLPSFAITTLTERRQKPFIGQQQMIFPHRAARFVITENFGARWGKVRGDLGVPDVTSHSFRKSLATLIDDEGLSARIGADHFGPQPCVGDAGHVHGPWSCPYASCGADGQAITEE